MYEKEKEYNYNVVLNWSNEYIIFDNANKQNRLPILFANKK